MVVILGLLKFAFPECGAKFKKEPLEVGLNHTWLTEVILLICECDD